MPRPIRIELPGVPLHVIQRGNNRSPCFLSDGDRHFYLKRLAEVAARHACAVHAYVLMSNHVHLLVTPEAAGGVARMMQDLGRRYVRVFNDVHGRTGTLWEGRYKAAMVDGERYFLTCQRYIELNPARAGLVDDPAEYRWSSHRHYIFGFANSLLTHHALWGGLGDDDGARRQAYAALFGQPIPRETLDEIRASTNGGWPLGSDDFIRHVEATIGRPARPPKRGRPARPAESPGGDSAEMFI